MILEPPEPPMANLTLSFSSKSRSVSSGAIVGGKPIPNFECISFRR